MDYKEYGRFIAEFRNSEVVDREDMIACMLDRFDYLAEDEVEIILEELL